MASNALTRRATLLDLPPDFSGIFFNNTGTSLKSRQQGYKYYSEGYVHSVSMSICDEKLFIRAKCHRSMRKNEEAHGIDLEINNSMISDIHCSCQAGMSGHCSHVVGVVLALQQWQLQGLTDVPSELSCTSLPQQWAVPRGNKIEPVAVPQMTIVNPKPSRKRRPNQTVMCDSRKIGVSKQDIEHLKSLHNCPISYIVCQTEKKIETQFGAVSVGSGLSTHAKFFNPKKNALVSAVCGSLKFPQLSDIAPDECFSNLPKLDIKECYKIEEDTRDQTKSPAWFAERKMRITASVFGEILKRKKITDKFIDKLKNPKPFYSEATSYGVKHEKEALEQYIKVTGYHLHDCGLVFNPYFPYLGATPDSKVCIDGVTAIVEVKCPYSARDLTINDASKTIKGFLLIEKEGKLFPNEKHNYYYQIQGQLLVTGVKFCELIVYTKKDISIHRIYPCGAFMTDMLNKLTRFYCEFMNTETSTQSDCQLETKV